MTAIWTRGSVQTTAPEAQTPRYVPSDGVAPGKLLAVASEICARRTSSSLPGRSPAAIRRLMAGLRDPDTPPAAGTSGGGRLLRTRHYLYYDYQDEVRSLDPTPLSPVDRLDNRRIGGRRALAAPGCEAESTDELT